MKKALMVTGVAVLAIGLFLAVSGKQNQNQVLSSNQATVGSSVDDSMASIALMDRGLTAGAIDYWKIEPEKVEGGKIGLGDDSSVNDELEPIIITAPRYRPEEEKKKVELLRKTPSARETEPGFLGEYRATIQCGKKCRKAMVKE